MRAKTIKYDLLLVKSDPMLALSMATPILLWLLVKFIFPPVQDFLLQWNYDIREYYYPVVILLLPIIPMMFGMVYGFIFLDERDSGIIESISVTPLGKKGYLFLRLGLPIFFSFIVIIIFSFTTGLLNIRSYIQILYLSVLLTLNTPVMLLFLGAFASNKIEGMALSKAFGVLLAGMMIDIIFDYPVEWIGAFSPLFWLGKAYFSGSTFLFLLYTTVGFLFYLLLLKWLWHKFKYKTG